MHSEGATFASGPQSAIINYEYESQVDEEEESMYSLSSHHLGRNSMNRLWKYFKINVTIIVFKSQRIYDAYRISLLSHCSDCYSRLPSSSVMMIFSRYDCSGFCYIVCIELSMFRLVRPTKVTEHDLTQPDHQNIHVVTQYFTNTLWQGFKISIQSTM